LLDDDNRRDTSGTLNVREGEERGGGQGESDELDPSWITQLRRPREAARAFPIRIPGSLGDKSRVSLIKMAEGCGKAARGGRKRKIYNTEAISQLALFAARIAD